MSALCFALLVATAKAAAAGRADDANGAGGASRPEITDRVFFDVAIDGQSAGRILLGLFGTVAPRTVRGEGRPSAARSGQKSKRAAMDTGTDTRLPVSLIEPKPSPPMALSSPSR